MYRGQLEYAQKKAMRNALSIYVQYAQTVVNVKLGMWRWTKKDGKDGCGTE